MCGSCYDKGLKNGMVPAKNKRARTQLTAGPTGSSDTTMHTPLGALNVSDVDARTSATIAELNSEDARRSSHQERAGAHARAWGVGAVCERWLMLPRHTMPRQHTTPHCVPA
jgi:hypothetical protein